MVMRVREFLIVASVLCVSCGMGPFAGPGGGDENLPQSGAGPYLFAAPDFETPADEPYILAQPVVSLTDPAVRQREDGLYEVFFTRTDADVGEIWKATYAGFDELPVQPPVRVLSADREWEAGVVRSPALVESGSELLLYYEGGVDSPSIGIARSTNDGLSFEKESDTPLVQDAKDPDVVISDGRWLLVYGDPAGEAIFLRTGSDERSFGEARLLLSARLGLVGAFDSLGVSAPALRIRTSSAGRDHFGLFYAGVGLTAEGEALSNIGYQGSFDTYEWAPFLAGEPILAAGPAGAGGPAPLLSGTESLLFVHQVRQGRGRLAIAFGP